MSTAATPPSDRHLTLFGPFAQVVDQYIRDEMAAGRLGDPSEGEALRRENAELRAHQGEQARRLDEAEADRDELIERMGTMLQLVTDNVRGLHRLTERTREIASAEQISGYEPADEAVASLQAALGTSADDPAARTAATALLRDIVRRELQRLSAS